MNIVKVGSLCQQLRGVSYGKGDASSVAQDSYLPVLRATNIVDGEVNLDELVFVPVEKIRDEQLLRDGDVLIAASSGSIKVVGKAARVRNNLDAAFGAFCKVLRPNEKVDTGYFNHFFQTRYYRHTISHLAAGANINNLRNEHIEDLEIPLPPLEEQHRISAILDKAEELLQKRRHALARLDDLLQSVFLEMFGDPVTNPMGWEVKKLGGLVKNLDSKRIPVKKADREKMKGIYPYYGASGIIDYVDNYLFEGERLLVSEDGANLLARTTPIAFIADGKYWVNNHAHVLAYNGNASLRYLEYFFSQIDLTPFTTGTAQPKLNQKNLVRIPVPCPPEGMQLDFQRFVDSTIKLKRRQKVAEEKLDLLFGALQQKAFRGEL